MFLQPGNLLHQLLVDEEVELVWQRQSAGLFSDRSSSAQKLADSDAEFFINSIGTVQPTVTSAATASDERAAFVANLEGNIYVRPMPNVTLRAFGGLNFDSAVPGVRAPSFTGGFGFAAPTVAAGINYHNETSYYAGGGLKIGF